MSSEQLIFYQMNATNGLNLHGLFMFQLKHMMLWFLIRLRKMEIHLTNFPVSRFVSGRRGSSFTGMWHSVPP